MDGKVAGDARAGGGETVIDEDAFQAAKGAAADVFRHANAAESECGRASDDVAGKVFVPVPAESVGRQLPGSKGERKVPDGMLLRIE